VANTRKVNRYLWLSDTHLNLLRPEQRHAFIEWLVLRGDGESGLLISGELTDGPALEETLAQFANTFPGPILFVLGNHDFYHSSLKAGRKIARNAAKKWRSLYWLTESNPVTLSKTVGIVGHDGWADSRFGNFRNSPVELNDFSS